MHEDKVEVRPGKITYYTWYRTPDVAAIVPFIDKDTLVMIRYLYVEDIRKIEIVSIEELKRVIIAGNVENAGTLIAYLICCTGML